MPTYTRPRCSICNKALVEPNGPIDAKLFILADVPGWKDYRDNGVFIAEDGKVLQQELAKVGIQFGRCRSMYLWPHEPPKDKAEHAKEFEKWLPAALEQMKKCLTVVLIGTELSTLFLKKPLGVTYGIIYDREAAPMMPANVKHIITIPKPSGLLSDAGVVGDLRFCLKQLKTYAYPGGK